MNYDCGQCKVKLNKITLPKMPFSEEYSQKDKRVVFHLDSQFVPMGISSLDLVEDLLCKLSHDINNLFFPPLYQSFILQ